MIFNTIIAAFLALAAADRYYPIGPLTPSPTRTSFCPDPTRTSYCPDPTRTWCPPKPTITYCKTQWKHHKECVSTYTTWVDPCYLDFKTCYYGCPLLKQNDCDIWMLPRATTVYSNLVTTVLPATGVAPIVTAVVNNPEVRRNDVAPDVRRNDVGPDVRRNDVGPDAGRVIPPCLPCATVTTTVQAPVICKTVVVCNPILNNCPKPTGTLTLTLTASSA